MAERLTRDRVPVEQTWDLSDLFPSWEAWEAECRAVAEAIPAVTAFRGRLGEGPAVLRDCLEAAETLQARFSRLYTYASLRAAEDSTSAVNQAAAARAAALGARLQAELAFIRTEVLALPEGTVERYLAEEPGLAPYRRWLEEVLADRPHTLGAEAEAALAALGEVLGAPLTIYNRAKLADMRFEPLEGPRGERLPMSFALYEAHYELSPDTELRRRAWAAFVRGLAAYQHTLAATFATEVRKNVALARIRGFPSAEHMLLRPQRVAYDVYRNVLDGVQREVAPHFRRLARLRRRVLGLDRLLHCDLKAPLDPGYEPGMTYGDAARLIEDALAVLGPEYREIIHNALTRRWVDRADNVGKSTGAFCSSPYGVHPYILMTWTDTMRDAFVLAHELGHAGHFGLAMRYQRFVNLRPSLFFVEAPSTLNELLLGQHILAQSRDRRVRRWVIAQWLGTYHHNFVTHLLEAELQRRVYARAEAGEAITAATLSALKGEILAEFWGEELEVDEGARLTWARQPHYYMGLYPYTYAAGLVAATAVAQAIRSEGQPAVDRWLAALKAGGTLGPLELMRLAGVDMASPEPIRRAAAFVGQLVDELEELFA